MPLFGSHLSIAGGLHNALDAASALGMETVQLFTHSPSQWVVKAAESGEGRWLAKTLPEDQVREFRKLRKKLKLKFPTTHDSYLINLASPDPLIYDKSLAAFVEEMHRAESLELSYLVMHPGAHLGSGEDEGLRRVAAAFDEIHRRCSGYRVKVLIETTAGQGTTLGYRFEHLASILENVAEGERLGVCLDTCHVLAAGYDITTREGYDRTMSEFEELIGVKRILAFHVNDSLKPLGSRVDRHAHLGKGFVGLEAFRCLVNDPRFRDRPMILETPKEEGDNDAMDEVNLAVLRDLIGTEAKKSLRGTDFVGLAR